MTQGKKIQYIGIGIVLLGIAGYVATGYFKEKQELKELLPDTQVVTIGNTNLTVSVVDTPGERRDGLSGTTEVPHDGMLFVFEKADIEGIWMKDMNYAIDIVWINDAFEVVDILENVTPDTYPTVFYPPQPVRYVLETRSGFTKEKGIEIWQKVKIKK